MYDVAVIGSGPAGNAAAKRCAELGLETLQLERHTLPRKKVCDATMSPGAQALLKEEFGEIPISIRCDPPTSTGVVWYLPKPFRYHYSLPWIWRGNLDHWMCQQAVQAGAELWVSANLIGFREEGTGYLLEIRRESGTEQVGARYIIGADGAASRIRKKLFPELQIPYLQQGQDRYQGTLDLDRRNYHVFKHTEPLGLGCYGVSQKDDLFVVSCAAEMGKLPELIVEYREFLQQFGFDPNQEPEWSGRCVEPVCAEELTSYRFRPGLRNVLLAGDAGGFMMPLSLEGVGPGIRSGLMAADAVWQAMKGGIDADQVYFQMLEHMLSLFRESHEYESAMVRAMESGDHDRWYELHTQAEFQACFNDY